MDSRGDIYVDKTLLEEITRNGEQPEGVVESTPEDIARIIVKPGCDELTREEAQALATLTRRDRRAVLSELRRGMDKHEALSVRARIDEIARRRR